MNNLFTLDRKGENNGGQVIWSQDQLSYLAQQYELHHSIPQLASQFGVSDMCIRNILRKQGVKILSLSELHTLDFPRNSLYFHKIDTPDKAYWLGFLMADGTLSGKNQIALGLKKEDSEHVLKFQKAIGAINHKTIETKKVIGEKIFYQTRFTIKDYQLYNDLVDKGCVPNKTFKMHFPTSEEVPENLLSHYIRGYFDGDGSLHWTQSGNARRPNWRIGFVCGDKAFLEQIRHILNKDKIAIEDRTTYYMLQISGNKQLIPILEYIYKDADDSILLTRKKQIYDKFLLQSIGGEPVSAGCE